MAQKCRGWCFTVNNDTFEDLYRLLKANFVYCVFGFETGKNGTPHMQGFLYFKNPVYMSHVKELLPRAHLEYSKGTPQENYDYCTKDGDFYEFGKRPVQGIRSDLIEIRDKIINKNAMRDIAHEHFGSFIRYHKGFEKFKQMQESVENKDVKTQLNYITIEDYNRLLESDDDDYFFACEESDLVGYDDNKKLVIVNTKKFNTYKLQLLDKNKGYRVKYGYDFKIIKPSSVFIVKEGSKK